MRTTEYAGFTLVHRRRNSLVERIHQQGSYEADKIEAIARELASSKTRAFLDVGANIGLISLGVLALVPDAHVYAVEPGPEQFTLLAETIRRNGLADRIDACPLAFSNVAGEATFSVHTSRHAAGDGLLDTGRAGAHRSVSVRTETLDGWWEAEGRPPVAVVKLDTEGSELLVLEGARSFVAECRPTIFVEIHELNVRPYPYGVEDVRRFIEGLGYELATLGRSEFVARPA